LTGPADQCRHDSQWQYPIAAGSPDTVNSTAPQKHLPAWFAKALPPEVSGTPYYAVACRPGGDP
jgi:hypothetical protein